MQRQSWVVPPCAFKEVSRVAGGKQEPGGGDLWMTGCCPLHEGDILCVKGIFLVRLEAIGRHAKSATKMESKNKVGGLVKTNICRVCDAPEQLKTGLRWLILMLKCEHTNPGL